MSRKAQSTEKGRESATTMLGLTPPMNSNSTRATRATPCSRALVTVPTAAATRDFCS